MEEPNDKDEAEHLFCWVEENLGVDIRTNFAHNDWTLVVKLHALVETALNMALVRRFQAPELDKIIGKLDTSNPSTGKVAFAKRLGFLSDDCAAFVQKLSELRNFCVHDIRNFNFRLHTYVSELDENKRHALLKMADKQVSPEMKDKTSLWVKLMAGTLGVMSELNIHDLRCRGDEARNEVYRLKAELYDRQNPPTPKEG